MYEAQILDYLNRIGIDTKPGANIENLHLLHKRHLLTVPFENLDIHLGKIILIDPTRIYSKVVKKLRGGFCYELNTLFHELLINLGFEAAILSARVAQGNEKFGSDFDHMAMAVNVGDKRFLADVGFGDFSMIPLELKLNYEQKSGDRIYKIIKHDEKYLKVVKSEKGADFKPEYIFTLLPRKLKEFKEMCLFHQYSPDSKFTRQKLCSLATDNGRVTLTDKSLIITADGKKKTYKIKDDLEFQHYLKEIFNISLKFD